MNNVKLLHIKCIFFQFFNNPVVLKNLKKFAHPRKSWNDAHDIYLRLLDIICLKIEKLIR